MKKLLTTLAILLPFLCGAEVVTLDNWKMSSGDISYDVTVPCTVAGALNTNGFFGADLLDGENYFAVDKSIFDNPWTFETSFAANAAGRQILRFEGLGFYADIFVNGTQIASADTTSGVFRIREYDVTALAKAENSLKVVLTRAQKGDLNNGFVDWNPRPLDESMGIWRPVYLINIKDAEIADLFVKPLVNPEDLSKASIEVRTTLVNRADKAVRGRLKIEYDGRTIGRRVVLASGETREVVITSKVRKPRIWWSWDLGKPELYNLTASFKSTGKLSDSREVTFGLRSIEGIVDELGHRQFILNGKKVLIKSAGWSDDILMQDTDEKLAAQISYVKDMNLNSVRFENIWGKSSEVYDLCDRAGLLVLVGWSCQWEWEDYCGLPETHGYGCINDPASEDMAVAYFHDQLIWLRNHPSIIAWLTGSDRIPNPRLEERYMELYNALEYRPYVCSAKALTSKFGGPSGMKMEGPYEYVGPDYWYLDKDNGGAFGFNTETCTGASVPQAESIKRFVGEDNLWPLGQAWYSHCSASKTAMNNLNYVTQAIDHLYGPAKSFEDFIRKAHSADYDATRAMFEAFRCNLPRTTGIVQWMLNSAWPALYWQLFDWYLVPTAAYYGVKKGCAPVQLIYNYADRRIYAVNETAAPVSCKASVSCFGRDGRSVGSVSADIVANPREPLAVSQPLEGAGFVQTMLQYDDICQDNFYAIPERNNTYDWKKSEWYLTPITEWMDLRFVYELPKADVSFTTETQGESIIITVKNNSDFVAYQNVLKAKNPEGELCAPAYYTDNFFSLAPGETKTITCTVPGQSNVTISLVAE